ncbi:restriction endonuclease, partial [Salmonella enterica]|nr:restriction endonuclease [Salmonella enterica subsp. enterica serovar Newport]EBP1503432.1 restriction endonuclease [Salmonella enterica]
MFPGISHYHDSEFPHARLTMLASKSTCKDRWRQMLNEAVRISDKHLLTL